MCDVRLVECAEKVCSGCEFGGILDRDIRSLRKALKKHAKQQKSLRDDPILDAIIKVYEISTAEVVWDLNEIHISIRLSNKHLPEQFSRMLRILLAKELSEKRADHARFMREKRQREMERAAPAPMMV